ncbi:MFS transporter [Marmoricola sp. URHB0036]|uniref:MFS transporter n=1 Tax=Marmoricola sp. URHB0036 TaxID=1298863 RepID=UPI0003FB520E|nr:MFS transporter [Marmoricola sp. URHB0036]
MSVIDPTVPQVQAPRRALATGILIFAAFMDLIDVTIVNVALPSIRDDLHATPAHLEWVLSGYTLTFAVLLITGGRLGDNVGRRTMFLLGVGGFTLASLGACLSTNGDMLVVARVVQGGFAAMMVPQMLSSVQVLYPPRERAAVFGVVGAVSGTAAVIGPLLGGWLITHDAFGIGWRSIFLINIPVGLVILVLAWMFVPNTSSATAKRIDLPGVLLASAALFLLVFPLIEGHSQDWSARIWLMLAGSAVLMVLFVAVERRTEQQTGSSLLPMHLFANRGFSAGLVTQSVFQGSLAGFSLVTIIYVQAGLGFSAFHAGLMLLPFSIGAFVGTGISVPLGLKVGKTVCLAGALLQAVGVWWVARIIQDVGDDLTFWSLALPMLLAGIGLGLLVVPLVDIALATVPETEAGAASGTYGTFQQVGAALGIAVVGSVFFGAISSFTPAALRDADITASWWVLGGFLVCAVSTAFLPDREAVQEHARAQAEMLES